MAAINSTRELAKIRSKIDAQQQIVSQLESDLQQIILGSNSRSMKNIIDDVTGIYNGVPDGSILSAAFSKGNDQLDDGNPGYADDIAEQHIVRNMLSQARSLLGELRIEEAGWNQEIGEEKARRKELTELAKG
jgi:hypothetical protein